MTLGEIVRMPKVQLHCHLEGTLHRERFRELAVHHGVDIGVRGSGPLDATYRFADFGEFLLLFRDVASVLREPADFAALAADYAADAAAQNVRYAEIFVSPSVWTWFHRGIDVEGTFKAMRAAFDAAQARSGVEVAFICDLTRNFGAERALETAELAVAMKPYGVIGVGLGGDEARWPPELFAEAFAFARCHGLRTVAHAGEAAGAASVRAAVEVLGAERIGHGVRAIEDPAVVRMLASRGIPLEICPTSNRLTGAAPANVAHPMGALHAAGVCVTIDADDPALFGTTLVDEYCEVERTLGPNALRHFGANAISASFASPERKATLNAELEVSRISEGSVES
ncbi:MAG: adenosine deaminase [Candidatus Velthaea sp.]|jgi:adenosine deaminase